MNPHSRSVKFGGSTLKRPAAFLLVLSLLSSSPVYAEPDTPRTVAERQERVKVGFQKGKVLYDAGEYDKAIAEWDALKPYLEENSSVKKVISFLQSRVETAPSAPKSTAAPAPSRTDTGVTVRPRQDVQPAVAEPGVSPLPEPSADASAARVPEELPKLLERAARSSDSERAELESAASSAPPDDRQRLIDETFEKGKALYYSGEIDKALEVWGELKSYVDARVAGLLDEVWRKREELRRLREGVSAGPAQAVAPNEDLGRFLEETNRKLAAEAAASGARAGKDRAGDERFRKGFQEGRSLYEAGRVEEAIAAWRRLDLDAPLAQAVDDLEKTYRDSRASGKTSASVPAAAAVSADMADFLGTAARKMRLQAVEARARAAKAEEDFAVTEERGTDLDQAFRRGREHYEAGRLAEAVDAWAPLAEAEGPGGKMAPLIQELRLNAGKAIEARRAADEAVAKKPTLPALQEMEKFLGTVRARLAAEQQEATARKAQVERPRLERERAIDEAFRQGKLLYYQGLYDDAIREWENILPDLADAPRLERAIGDLKAAREEARRQAAEADRIGQTASDQEAAKARTPDELIQLLEQASKKIQSDIWETQARKKKADDVLKSREEEIRRSFDEGRALFDRGRTAEALDAWDRATAGLESESAIRRKLAELRLQSSNVAALARAAGDRPAAPRVPLDEISAAITAASKQLESEAQTLRSKQKQQNAAANERQAEIERVFEAGKTLYGQGRYDAAIGEWSRIPEFADDGAAVRQRIDELRTLYAASNQARAEAKKSAETADAVRAALPQEFYAVLEEAGRALKSETVRVRAETETARRLRDETLSRKQAEIDATFQAGRELLRQGRYEQAIGEWRKLLPYVDGQSGLESLLDALKDAHGRLEMARAETAGVSDKAFQGLRAPSGPLEQEIRQARERLEAQTQEALTQKARTEQSVAERQTWIQKTFEKGKTELEAGRVRDALEIWGTLAPYLEDEARVKESIRRVTVAYEQAEAARNAAEAAARLDGRKFTAPPALLSMVEGLSRGQRDEQKRAQDERLRIERERADAQARLEAGLSRARLALEEGKTDQALAAWRELLPLFENASELGALLDTVERDRSRAAEAQAALETSARSGAAKFRAPEELARLLDDLDRKARAQSKVLSDRATEADRARSDRQVWVTFTLQDGRKLFEAGKYEEALKVWATLAPYLEEGDQLKSYLDELGARVAELRRAEKASADSTAARDKRFAPPAALGDLLARLETDIDQRSRQAQASFAAADRVSAQKQGALASAFEKGRAAYQEGRFADAIGSWKTMTPLIAEGDALAAFLERLDQAVARYEQASLAARQANERGAGKFPAPAGLDEFLAKAGERLEADIRQAQAEKDKMDRAVTDRQAWVNTTFQKGRALLESGRAEEALAEWDKLSPYLDERSGIRERLTRVKASQAQALEAKKAAVEFAANEFKKTYTPEGFEQALEAAVERLRASAAAASAEKTAAERAALERRQRAEEGFAKAKRFLSEGRHPEALRELEALLGSEIDPASALAAQIQALRQTVSASASAQDQAKAAEAKRQERFAPPSDLGALLTKASQRLAQDTSASLAQKESAEKMIADRRTWIDETFRKGRSFEDAGKIDEALIQWEALLPYLVNEAEARAEIDAVKRSRAAALEASRAAEETVARQAGRFKAPADLKALLADAAKRLQAEALAADARRTAAQKTAAEREAASAAAFQKGRALYQSGDVSGALNAWQGLVPFVETPEDLTVSLKELGVRLEENRVTAAAAGELEARAGKVPAPAGLEETLTAAIGAVESDTRKAAEQRAVLEKELTATTAAASAAFQSGKAAFEAGRFDDAMREWDKIVALASADAKLSERLAALKAAYGRLAAARRTADDFAASRYKELRIGDPKTVQTLLEDAAARLGDETARAEEEKSKMEATLTERQAWIRSTFEKGKALHDKGRLKEALEVWGTLTPYFADEAAVKASLARVSEAAVRADAARAAADTAAASAAGKFPASDVFTATLQELSKRLETETAASQTEKAKADKAAADRRTWIQFTFQDGKSLYDTGRYEEAFELWGSIAPYLENGDAITAQIRQAAARQAELGKAREAAKTALAAQNDKFPVPADLAALVQAAQTRLEDERQQAEAERGKAETLVAERQRWIDATFAKGKTLADQGQFHEALREWGSLLPYLRGSAPLQAQMDKVSEAHVEALLARKSVEDATAKRDTKFEPPVELTHLLDQASQGLKNESFEADLQKAEAQKTLAERRAAMETVFRDGKTLYYGGKIAEAVVRWKDILPYLADPGPFEKLLAQVDENRALSEKAKQQARETFAVQSVKLAPPADLLPLLEQANQALKTEAFEAQAEKTKAEESLEQRQQSITAAFRQGKDLYNAGQYKEAVEEWTKLTPYMGEDQEIGRLIASVRQSQSEMLEAKKAAVEAVANEYKGLRLNYAEQMGDLLMEANRKLKTETEVHLKKKEDIESTIAERREWSTTTFNKGKILYEQDRYEEALQQWERLVPYLEGDSRVRQQIEMLKATFNAYRATQEAAAPAAGGAPDDASYVDEMASFFDAASKKLENEAAAAKGKTEEAEKLFAKRKEWIEGAFVRGQEFYDQGRYAEAAKEWERLRPYVAEKPEIQSSIELAMSKAEEADRALKAAEAVRVRQEALVPVPQALTVPPPAPRSAAAEVDVEALAASVAPSGSETGEAEGAPQGDLAFVSGEVTAVDAGGQTLTMKLYTVQDQKDFTIQYDASTKIDGVSSQPQAVDTLQAGIAIDLRYDPHTNKALYIYVY